MSRTQMIWRNLILASCGLLLFSSVMPVSQSVQAETTSPATEAATTEPESKPVPVTAIRIEAATPEKIAISGKDSRQQVLVTGDQTDGRLRDLTRETEYKIQPAEVATIDADGLITPLSEGTAKLTATSGEFQSEFPLEISGIDNPLPINFKNQIAPIFTKLSCNGGGCHGKSGGQNGFSLSLLGFYPDDDYEFLVKENRGRRIFPPAPAESLLLTKATGQSPHGGGKRMEEDSYEYRMLFSWIEQGMPFGTDNDPVITGIECFPKSRVMSHNSEQQITVLATFSDGSTKDVTRMALFEPNDTEMADVSKTGLVSTLDLSGEVAIMARYLSQVSTFRATVPLGAEIKELPESDNLIDLAVFGKLKLLGIPPSDLCDDNTFIRRVSIDIAGRLPTEDEVRAFVADETPNKRALWIDQLLESPEYADYFAKKWNMILRNKPNAATDAAGTYGFYQWIWNSMYENKPYDKFVSEIITAAGDPTRNPAVIWYRSVNENNEQVEDTAQLFLGVRIQCARCHHHPFEKWSQNDYYSLSAFFSRIGYKEMDDVRYAHGSEKILVHTEGTAQANNPRDGQKLAPAGLGSEPFTIANDRDPRVYLAEWMSNPENPFFAKSVVNRYWKHFFSRGVVEPEDDMRETNPPTNPELLDNLSQHFVDNQFDLKDLVRTICNSKTYQLSAFPNEYNLKDKQNFSRYYPKRLTAEVLYDAFHQVTDTTQAYAGLPQGSRAVELRNPDSGPYFLKVFGQPQGDTACECERSQDANLAQSLHLLNSTEVQNKVSNDTGRAANLAKAEDSTSEEKIRELYRWMYAREPNPDELSVALAHIEKNKENSRTAYEDIVWALINTKEFLFNH
ncbi:Bacterial Ig-like domain (group 2) [Polystyrenella longa]|uniref:Bacterial Ig-like domain (Group 2) n=1 Tax=Polystyrenella longa TaxID=2528007 RepID=A0A518CL95_9PLAN|nr:DUF1549 domain-containing protein [Polystyrenella longa]QDU79997.1 Bacterial Ig-like domain (group 2) [Polystyrenella longa]